MDKEYLAQFKQQAEIMKALAHPTRLFIIHQLYNQKLCVGEITQSVGVDISTISKHLSILRNVGIIDFEKQGKSAQYYLKTPCVLNFFTCMRDIQKSNINETTRGIVE